MFKSGLDPDPEETLVWLRASASRAEPAVSQAVLTMACDGRATWMEVLQEFLEEEGAGSRRHRSRFRGRRGR